jgi:hypothetical protein
METTMEALDIQRRIYTIRSVQVMLDSDLALLYGVATKRLNEQVERNIDRFPEKFMFRLTSNEYELIRSQNATSKTNKGGRRYLPYVFTEQGVAMLSAVLKSETAVKMNISDLFRFAEKSIVIIGNFIDDTVLTHRFS